MYTLRLYNFWRNEQYTDQELEDDDQHYYYYNNKNKPDYQKTPVHDIQIG